MFGVIADAEQGEGWSGKILLPQRGYISAKGNTLGTHTGFSPYSGCYPELINIRPSGDGGHP